MCPLPAQARSSTAKNELDGKQQNNRKTTTSGGNHPAEVADFTEGYSSPLFWRILRILSWIVCAALVLEFVVLMWMITSLAMASGGGRDGEVVAVADEIKTKLPLHFKGFQTFMAFTGSWYTNSHAKVYFEQQRPLFEAAATNFKLHRYFSTMVVPNKITWNNMIHERIKAFAQLQTAEGRDDFRVEKDRCAMYQFFKNNGLRIVEVLGQWSSQAKFVSELKDGSVANLTKAWPIFVKACHLTQSSSKGTRLLESADALEMQVADNSMLNWVDTKWKFRAHDFERQWVKEGDQLTDSLQPSMLVQGPFQQPGFSWKAHGRYAVGLLEFRVEVLWGRAYLAQLDGCMLFFRDGVIEDYSTPLGFLKVPMYNTARVQWIQDEGYMKCVWELAEKAARATATEYVRIDLFLKRGDPNGCTINENSLSSGLLYWGHENYLAQTWAAHHTSKKYQLLDSNKPVYELTPQETQH